MINDLIGRLSIFSQLPASEVNYLAGILALRECPANTLLICEGCHEEYCYILIEGQVEIVKALDTPDQRSLGIQQPVSFLGEVSFFRENGQHSASVRSLTPVKLLVMTRADFESLLERQPRLGLSLLRTFSTRLTESENQTILDLQDRNRKLTEAYDHLKEAHEQIIEKEKLERELDVARNIQRSILPEQPPHMVGLDIAALMVPTRSVGGDFYDFIPVNSTRLGLVIGDVTDKGVPAALFMALTFSLIRAEAEAETSPAKVLVAVNRQLLHMNSAGLFVTVLYGILDIQTREFQYARAAHEVPILLDGSGDEIVPHQGHGQPLGLFDEPMIDSQSLLLPANATLILFTDGVPEAFTPQHTYYGLDGLKTVIRENHQASAQNLCRQVYEAVNTFTNHVAQQDDITLMCLHLS